MVPHSLDGPNFDVPVLLPLTVGLWERAGVRVVPPRVLPRRVCDIFAPQRKQQLEANEYRKSRKEVRLTKSCILLLRLKFCGSIVLVVVRSANITFALVVVASMVQA